MSVTAFEDKMEGALWRNAWHAHDLYAAFGAKRKDEQPLKPEDFYGRELAEIRAFVGESAVTPALSAEQAAKLARARLAVLEAQMRRDHPDRVVGDTPQEPEPSPPA